MPEITELVTKFSFQGSLDPLGRFRKELSGASLAVIGIQASIAVAGIAFAKFASDQLMAIAPLSLFNQQTDIAVGKMQAMSYAATQTGGSGEAMQSTLKGLTRTLATAAWQGNETFARLGISARDSSGHIKTADVALDEIRHRFQEMNLSAGEKGMFMSALGIDESLIGLMGKTDSEMGSLLGHAKQLGVLSQGDTEKAAKFKESVEALNFGLGALKDQIAIGVAPRLTEMTKGFLHWIEAHKGWIVHWADRGVRLLEAFGAAAVRLQGPLLAITGAFTAWKAGSLALSLISTPIGQAVIVSMALLLILDDIIAAYNGIDSVSGRVWKKLTGRDAKKDLHELASAWGDVSKNINAALNHAKQGYVLSAGADLLRGKGGTTLVGAGGGMAIAAAIAAATGVGLPVAAALMLAGTALGGAGGAALPQVGGNLAPGSQVPATAPAGSGVVNMGVTNYYNIQSTDPKAAAAEINDIHQRQLRDAEAQTGKGAH